MTKRKKTNNELINHYFDYLTPNIIIKKLKTASYEINKNMVESINKKLTTLKNIFKNVPKYEAFKVEENEKIIDIVERILELNSEKQLGL